MFAQLCSISFFLQVFKKAKIFSHHHTLDSRHCICHFTSDVDASLITFCPRHTGQRTFDVSAMTGSNLTYAQSSDAILKQDDVIILVKSEKYLPFQAHGQAEPRGGYYRSYVEGSIHGTGWLLPRRLLNSPSITVQFSLQFKLKQLQLSTKPNNFAPQSSSLRFQRVFR